MRRVFDLTSPERTVQRDRALGATLAFVAGATNAGGFISIGQYTSHMTGMVSSIADNLALGRIGVALAALGAVLSFLAGAMTTAISVNWARHRRLRCCFAIPLVLEAMLLLGFGLLGGILVSYTAFVAPLTVLVLCYLMGLQNAVITKISRAEIRTTHVTGLVTDIGIELGRLVYAKGQTQVEPGRRNLERLSIHLLIFTCFLTGGLAGACGFKVVGYVATLPLAALLVIVGVKPITDDLKAWS